MREQPLAAEVGPELLGHERDHRVGERDGVSEDREQGRGERPALLGVGLGEAVLDELQVPVAQLAEEEVIQAEG